MGAFIVEHDTALVTCLDLAVTTRGLLAANPHTVSLAADFDAWIAQWKPVFLQEIDNRIATTSAAALEVSLDTDLNDLSDETSKAVLITVKGNREDPEYVFYYNGGRASDFKKPHMGPQLAGMRNWPDHMKVSPFPTLVDLGLRIDAKVKDSDNAITNTAKIETQDREFKLTGARRQLIDSLNALRKATYGTLAQMPHAHPEWKLPGTFADRFFRAERPTAPSRPPTVASLKLEMEAAKKALDTVTAAYQTAVKAEEDAAAQAQAQATLQKQLDDANAALKAQQDAVDALKAQIAAGAN
jgi:Sec-independent protein translocase protein TatA